MKCAKLLFLFTVNFIAGLTLPTAKHDIGTNGTWNQIFAHFQTGQTKRGIVANCNRCERLFNQNGLTNANVGLCCDIRVLYAGIFVNFYDICRARK